MKRLLEYVNENIISKSDQAGKPMSWQFSHRWQWTDLFEAEMKNVLDKDINNRPTMTRTNMLPESDMTGEQVASESIVKSYVRTSLRNESSYNLIDHFLIVGHPKSVFEPVRNVTDDFSS